MDWTGVLMILYGVALLSGIVLSCALPSGRRRREIRVITIVFTVPMLLVIVGVSLLFVFMHSSQPPTIAELNERFVARKAALETLIRMANEDAHYSRIAPTFVDRDQNSLHPGRYMDDDPLAGLAKSRWDEYRTIYKQNGINLGIQRDEVGDAFIMLDSIGLLNRGHSTGYLFCDHRQPARGKYRFPPCLSNQNEGYQSYDPDTRKEAYSFRRIDGSWFAYDEGPS